MDIGRVPLSNLYESLVFFTWSTVLIYLIVEFKYKTRAFGAFVMPVAFLAPFDYSGTLLVLPLLGFFNNGIFSGFPIYLPELYPTRLRATGAGFCFNVGRILASVSPFMTGWLVTTLGTFGRAASTVALIYLVGLGVLLFAPETKGQPLKD